MTKQDKNKEHGWNREESKTFGYVGPETELRTSYRLGKQFITEMYLRPTKLCSNTPAPDATTK